MRKKGTSVSGYMDRRTLRIKELDDFTDEKSLRAITKVSLYGTEHTHIIDMTAIIVDEAIKASLHDGYSIEDHRYIYERGASSAFQEVIVAMVSGAAGSATTVFLQGIVEKLKELKQNKEISTKPIEEMVYETKQLLIENFNATEPLTLMEAVEETDETMLIVQDNIGIDYEIVFRKTSPFDMRARRISDKQA